MIEIRETSSGVSFAVKLQPKASKTAIIGEVEGALKISVNAPPVEGRANDALVKFIAQLLKVARSSVTIAAGASSRNKVIRVEGVTADQVRWRLKVW
jgi:uncharacterized protein (TIGR00251 family)